jgi:hypothetical protein
MTLGSREGIESAAYEAEAVSGEFEVGRPFSSLFSTTRDVLLVPRRFFDALAPDGPPGAPVLYFLFCTAITALINVLASLSFLAVPVVIAVVDGSLGVGLLVRILVIFVFASLIVLPVSFVAGFFVSVPIQHVFILLVAGRDQKGLSATLRVSCYSVGAPIAVAWIPVAGILAVFYCLYLHATGLKRVHGISTGKSLGATLMLTTLLLVLATFLAVYDYGLIQDIMK